MTTGDNIETEPGNTIGPVVQDSTRASATIWDP
jgi:hypothetical protein